MATYYVKSDGSNSPRTAAQAQNPSTPWATVTYAVSQISGGPHEVVLLDGGPYTETYWGFFSSLILAIRPQSGSALINFSDATRGIRLDTGDIDVTLVVQGISLAAAGLSANAKLIDQGPAAASSVTLTDCNVTSNRRCFGMAPNAAALVRKLFISGGLHAAGTAEYCGYFDDAHTIDIRNASLRGGSTSTPSTIEAYMTNPSANNAALFLITGCDWNKSIRAIQSFATVRIEDNEALEVDVASALPLIQVGFDGRENLKPLGNVYVNRNVGNFKSGAASISHGILLGSGCTHLEAEYNKAWGANLGIAIKAGSYQGSSSIGFFRYNFGHAINGNGIELKGARGLEISHNTGVGTGTANAFGLYWSNDTTGGSNAAPDTQDCTIKDNIFKGATVAMLCKDFVGDNVVDNNLLHSGGATLATITGTNYADLAALQAGWVAKSGPAGNDGASKQGDPLLVSPETGDASWPRSSPARRASSTQGTRGAQDIGVYQDESRPQLASCNRGSGLLGGGI